MNVGTLIYFYHNYFGSCCRLSVYMLSCISLCALCIKVHAVILKREFLCWSIHLVDTVAA